MKNKWETLVKFDNVKGYEISVILENNTHKHKSCEIILFKYFKFKSEQDKQQAIREANVMSNALNSD